MSPKKKTALMAKSSRRDGQGKSEKINNFG